MQQYTYLIINILTIIVCFIFSFHPKINFNKYFKVFIVAASLAAIPYIVWDIIFTYNNVWWFNYSYTTGIKIINLPIEEILFFWCIPFSCVFTYFCLNKFIDFSYFNKYNRFLSYFLILFFVIVLIFFNHKIYITIVSLSIILLLIYFLFNNKIINITSSSLIYLVLMLGFIPVNGVLTGYGLENPIVNYNPRDILGIRLLTIPIEDIGFGYGMFLLNVFLFEKLKFRFSLK
jgi:lycopene cyclase domain-containing protein